jgi:hypothetical protein
VCSGLYYITQSKAHVGDTPAKYIANCRAQAKQQEKTRVVEKHVQPKEQQVMSTMLSYQSMERMVQSLGREGQQQWRIGHCSQLEGAATDFL